MRRLQNHLAGPLKNQNPANWFLNVLLASRDSTYDDKQNYNYNYNENDQISLRAPIQIITLDFMSTFWAIKRGVSVPAT